MLSARDLRNQGRVTNNPAPPAAAPYGSPSTSGAIKYTCPLCRGALTRIGRRPIDRLSSQFVPAHRFRCEGFSCGWEGTLRVDGADSGKKPGVLERAATASMVALVLVTSVAVAVMLVAAMVGWFSARDRQQEQVSSVNNQCLVAIDTASPPTFTHCATPASTG